MSAVFETEYEIAFFVWVMNYNFSSNIYRRWLLILQNRIMNEQKTCLQKPEICKFKNLQTCHI